MLIASMCSKAYRKVIVITTTVVVHTGAAAYMTVRLVVTRDFEFLRRGIDCE
jgi:UDP-glucose 6-dehydrogenase